MIRRARSGSASNGGVFAALRVTALVVPALFLTGELSAAVPSDSPRLSTPALASDQPVSTKGSSVSQPPPAADSEDAPAFDRSELRDRLQRRLAESKDAQRKIEEAIAAIDRGDSREKILAIFPNHAMFRGLLDRADAEDGEHRGPFQGRDGLPRGPRGPRGGMQTGDPDRPARGDEPADGSPGGGPERRGVAREATDADRAIVREILQHAAPEMLATLDELAAKDPDAARRKLTELFPRLRWMIELRERDRKVYDIRLVDLELARKSLPIAKEILDLRTKETPADDPALRAKLTQLRTLITRQFENRERSMRAEAEAWRARAAERDTEIETMSMQREQIIDRLMEGLIKRSSRPGRFDDFLGPVGGGPSGGPPRDNRGERKPRD